MVKQEKPAGQKVGDDDIIRVIQPIDRVRQLLRSDLIDVYRQQIPAFQSLGREEVYNRVMNSPVLASACYELFERQPDLFKHLMIGRDGRPVQDKTQKLSCGRSVQEVTAMVVRAVAKRHFLQRFSAPPLPDSAPPARPWRDLLRLRFWRGLLATHRRWRRLQRARAQPQKFVRKATRGDSLYLALRQYLLYHWQLPLIPHYTPLPVSLVRKLGPRILDYRSSQSLKALLLEHSKQTAVPVPASKPKPILHKIFAQPEHAHSVGQARLETLWQRAQILGLAACFKVTDAELRRMVLLASQSSTEIFDCLVARGFGLDTILILLCAFERQLGQARMRQLFGAAMQPDFPATLARLLENGGLQGLSRREDIKLRAELIIRQLHRANNLAGRKPLVQELARSVQS